MNKGTIAVDGNIASMEVAINGHRFELRLKDGKGTTRSHQVSSLDNTLYFGPLRETTCTYVIDPTAGGAITYEINPVQGIVIKFGGVQMRFGQRWSLWSRLWVFIRPWARAPREMSSPATSDA